MTIVMTHPHSVGSKKKKKERNSCPRLPLSSEVSGEGEDGSPMHQMKPNVGEEGKRS
jgi:hypothetical protein